MSAWELALAAVEQHRAEQKPQELAELIGRLAEHLNGARLDNVLEIGCQSGGTFWLWRQLAAPTAWILSIDQQPGLTALDQMGTNPRHCIYMGNSHNKGTGRFAEGFFGTRELDLLFIDGDHTYQGVKADYEDYEPMVKDGGLVVFHDIAPHPPEQSEVHRLWAELEGDKWETVYPEATNLWNGGVLPPDSCGIGVLRVVK